MGACGDPEASTARGVQTGFALGAQGGFTLVEVLVAIVVTVLGVLGLVGAFDSARRLSLLAERRTAMAHRAQLEVERLQTYPFAQLEMISAPSHSSQKTSPDYSVNKCGAEYCYAWNAENTGEEEKLVDPEKTEAEVECGTLEATKCGRAAASPTGRKCSEKVGACEWSDGPLTGNVYDFITWHNDSKCTECKVKEKAYIRLTVVVTVKVPAGNHEPTPLRVSTLVAKPG
jgi:Tfp pilus assembly protein PilV